MSSDKAKQAARQLLADVRLFEETDESLQACATRLSVSIALDRYALERQIEEAEWWASRENSGNGLCEKESNCAECASKREHIESLRVMAE